MLYSSTVHTVKQAAQCMRYVVESVHRSESVPEAELIFGSFVCCRLCRIHEGEHCDASCARTCVGNDACFVLNAVLSSSGDTNISCSSALCAVLKGQSSNSRIERRMGEELFLVGSVPGFWLKEARNSVMRKSRKEQDVCCRVRSALMEGLAASHVAAKRDTFGTYITGRQQSKPNACYLISNDLL